MNRIVFSLTALLGALMPLVFDSTLKGAVLLGMAAFCALLLHRASAATRHLVWLVAIVALLLVPLLSVALPQWRVLPGWAVVRPLAAASGELRDRALSADTARGVGAVGVPPLTGSLPANPPPSAGSRGQSVSSAPSVAPDPVWTWRDWLAPIWGVGFAILALRLFAAHLLLRCGMRGCSVVWTTPGNPETDRLAAHLEAASAQLGIRQRVTLLLDDRRTIPVVWGVFRPRLLLPGESLEWSDEQVRSVLLHELAHVQRRDTLDQWLTQIACALHWWNPLVWLAAWRLHAERERACDDLVLASGVRPSAYAEHLLHVATKLSPARWTAACGLAMARNSSLEGRLLAVLSQKLNRRGITRALTATTLAIGTLIAIPLAMLRAADEGNPVTQLEGLTWNAAQDGLSLGYRITGDEWRILGKPVKVELWVRNEGDKPVKFQSIARPDIGLRLKLRNERGEETESTIVPNDRPPLGELRLLPPGHAFKVKEFAVLLFRPVNDVSGVKDHFFPIEPGAYDFHCELELPGFSATGRGGGQLTPAAGEWTGKLTTRGLSIRVVALEAPAMRTRETGPRADAQTVNARREMAKLTAEALLGTWRGTVNQEKLMLSFHRPPAEQGVQCDIYFGEATIGALARFDIAEDGGLAEVIHHSAGGGMRFGTLLPIEPGKLMLKLYGRQKGQQEVILVRDPEGAATEPRQAEPRELFKMWKATANEDGTIPGAFIGALAKEVRAYVETNPTRASAMELAKLLPRFVTSRHWTQAEAIRLLDDVAYCAPSFPFTRAGTAAKAGEVMRGP